MRRLHPRRSCISERLGGPFRSSYDKDSVALGTTMSRSKKPPAHPVCEMRGPLRGLGSHALYQGTTLVGPHRGLRDNWALAPAALAIQLLPSTSGKPAHEPGTRLGSHTSSRL